MMQNVFWSKRQRGMAGGTWGGGKAVMIFTNEKMQRHNTIPFKLPKAKMSNNTQ